MTQSLSDLFDKASLKDCLPYRSFDPETQIFVNRSSHGFVLETLPLVGCGEEIPRQLTGLFQHTLPLGSNLQCLLIGSNHIGSWLNKWVGARKHSCRGHMEILEELAKERKSYLSNLSGIRTFRLILSYSEPHSIFTSFNAILALREQMMTTLKGWGLPIKIWNAGDLLSGLDELLNPSSDLESLTIPWNPYDLLSHQFMSPSSRWKIEPSQMVFDGSSFNEPSLNETKSVFRLYTPRLFPTVWHLSAMGVLIGDPFDDFLRLKGNFFISYGVHIPFEKTLKTKMLAKCGNVEKQAASPIAKYVPSLRKEAEEWTLCTGEV